MADFNFYINRQGIRGIRGEKGEQGFSPIISVKTETASEYVLHIENENASFDTPNLRGNAISSQGGTYVRINPDTQEMYAGDADIASIDAYGTVILSSLEELSSGGNETSVPTSADVYDFVQDSLAGFEGGVSEEELNEKLNVVNERIEKVEQTVVTHGGVIHELKQEQTFQGLVINNIQSELENKLDFTSLKGVLKEGDNITLDVNDDNQTITISGQAGGGSGFDFDVKKPLEFVNVGQSTVVNGTVDTENSLIKLNNNISYFKSNTTVTFADTEAPSFAYCDYKLGQVVRVYGTPNNWSIDMNAIGQVYKGLPLAEIYATGYSTASRNGIMQRSISDLKSLIDSKPAQTNGITGSVSQSQLAKPTTYSDMYQSHAFIQLKDEGGQIKLHYAVYRSASRTLVMKGVVNVTLATPIDDLKLLLFNTERTENNSANQTQISGVQDANVDDFDTYEALTSAIEMTPLADLVSVSSGKLLTINIPELVEEIKPAIQSEIASVTDDLVAWDDLQGQAPISVDKTNGIRGTFDTEPTDGSSNFISSGAVKKYVDEHSGGDTPDNMVTTDTEQVITASKTFRLSDIKIATQGKNEISFIGTGVAGNNNKVSIVADLGDENGTKAYLWFRATNSLGQEMDIDLLKNYNNQIKNVFLTGENFISGNNIEITSGWFDGKQKLQISAPNIIGKDEVQQMIDSTLGNIEALLDEVNGTSLIPLIDEINGEEV